jgi:RNA 2',3'-cyclic 3'-phosphodiesterase
LSHNLFFALWPDNDVRERIASAAERLKATHSPRGRWIKPHRYHLTLRYLGAHATLPEPLLAAAYDAGDSVRAAAFDFALDTAGSFRNRDIPWWLGCHEMPAGLHVLWDALADALSMNGFGSEEHAKRVAHVTILRDAARRLADESIAPVGWPVRDFVLVDSVIGGASSYTILRRWRLAGIA